MSEPCSRARRKNPPGTSSSGIGGSKEVPLRQKGARRVRLRDSGGERHPKGANGDSVKQRLNWNHPDVLLATRSTVERYEGAKGKEGEQQARLCRTCRREGLGVGSASSFAPPRVPFAAPLHFARVHRQKLTNLSRQDAPE